MTWVQRAPRTVEGDWVFMTMPHISYTENQRNFPGKFSDKQIKLAKSLINQTMVNPLSFKDFRIEKQFKN